MKMDVLRSTDKHSSESVESVLLDTFPQSIYCLFLNYSRSGEDCCIHCVHFSVYKEID